MVYDIENIRADAFLNSNRSLLYEQICSTSYYNGQFTVIMQASCFQFHVMN